VLASNTYRCIGGPHDGQERAIPPGHTSYRVEFFTLAGSRMREASPFGRRTVGEYRLRRHRTHGYVLWWTGECEITDEEP